MSPFSLAVGLGENASQSLARGGLAAVALLCPLTNPHQYFHARLEIGVCDISQQFVTKFVGSCVDLGNYPLGASAEKHHFATAIMWRICARNPSLPLQAVQQRDHGWLFDSQTRCNLGLR